MNRTFAIALAAVAVLGTAQAKAQSVTNEGLYVSGGAGISFVSDSTLSQAGTSVEAELSNGLALSGAVGYRFTENYRLEGELAYRTNDVDTIAGIGVDSEVTNLSFMANAYYDFQTDMGLTPYIGAGLGVSRIEVDAVSAGGINITTSDDDTVFAYAFMAGFSAPISDAVDIGLEYKFLGTNDPSFTGVDAEYGSQAVNVKVIYAF